MAPCKSHVILLIRVDSVDSKDFKNFVAQTLGEEKTWSP